MDQHATQIQQLFQQADGSEQARIKHSLRDLLNAFETPQEALLSRYDALLQLVVARVSVDLDLFQHFIDRPEPLSGQQLSTLTGASPDLLHRLLRYLATTPFLAQSNSSPPTFSPTPVAHALAQPSFSSHLIYATASIFPAILALPVFLTEHKYQNITDTKATPYQAAFQTELLHFQHLALPENKRAFEAFQVAQQGMAERASGRWMERDGGLDVFVAAAERQVGSDENVMWEGQGVPPGTRPCFVDVGGGYGQQCRRLLEIWPALKGRVVLEDLGEVVGNVQEIEGLQVVEQDFFERQAVHGAEFYYLRHILHGWPAVRAQEILANLAVVMSPTSRILVDEMVLPEAKASPLVAMMDLAMMIPFAGAERTLEEWHALVDGVVDSKGQKLLVIEDAHEHASEGYECILVLKLRQG